MAYNKVFTPLAILYGALLVWWVASGYLPLSGVLVLGAVVLAVLQPSSGGFKRPWQRSRFALAALACAGLGLLLPTRTLHFFTLGLAWLLAVETWRGRVGWQAPVVLVLMSSLVANWITVFGFPVRLALSSVAAKALAATGLAAHAEGNVIVLRGSEFAVDPACMGLSMVQLSLLFVVALTLLAARGAISDTIRGPLRSVHLRNGVPEHVLPLWATIFLLLVTVLLIALFNLLRIVLLCLFGWLPGTFLHEAAGLVGWALYVLAPLCWLVPRVYRWWGKAATPAAAPTPAGRNSLILNAVVATVVVLMALTQTARTAQPLPDQWVTLTPPFDTTGLQRQVHEHQVVSYYGRDVLVYLKPIGRFYAAEHSPLVCWSGSGFALTESGEDPGGFFLGKLQKEAPDGPRETLYTAWWYDNGAQQTNSQWAWRWAELRGSRPFFLVNVTADNPDTLLTRVRGMRAWSVR